MPSAIHKDDVSLDETINDVGRSSVSDVGSRESDPGPDPLIGARMHHFHVLRELGSGGMGAVYAARDESLQREVALKVLHPEYATEPSLRERFVREARAQARLHSPNVVHLYYIGQEADRLFFAMEMVDGPPLDKFIEQRGAPLSVDELLDAMEGIARSLKEAHENGFVHRDIKPGNLLRSSDGTVKLADFGLARPISSDSKITQSGMVIGSPAYMSPEQALGGEVDHRSDIYSLGATFFHLLTGHPPYEGATPIATITKHVTEPPPGPDAFGPAPAGVVQLLVRMLSKKPEERFDSYENLLAAIESARPQKITYAGMPTRIAVSVVDQVTFLILTGIMKSLAIPVFALYIVASTTMYGQTLGDRFFRVQVTREDASPLRAWHVLIRHAVCHWLAIVIGIEFLIVDGVGGLERYLRESFVIRHGGMGNSMLMVGAALLWNAIFVAAYTTGIAIAIFDKKRRTLHDRAAGTIVTYKL